MLRSSFTDPPRKMHYRDMLSSCRGCREFVPEGLFCTAWNSVVLPQSTLWRGCPHKRAA